MLAEQVYSHLKVKASASIAAVTYSSLIQNSQSVTITFFGSGKKLLYRMK
jgi:hypothetical protein